VNITCQAIGDNYGHEIEEIVRTQKFDNREAIFFIYEDGNTSDIYRGEATSISLSPDQEAEIASQGNIVSSVHSHPTGFDPSTVDIMTGLMTTQEAMCVATPIFEEDVEDDFVLTCVELGELDELGRRRMVRAMRRSSISITEIGRQIRKQANIQRFNVTGCRTHKVEVDGIELPVSSRPSKFRFVVGQDVGVQGSLDDGDGDAF
jgi:proteasome lid subunit RPN8/RPN11